MAQRSASMSLPLKWEFPGGKIEVNESAEECLIREVTEELGISVSVTVALRPVTHSYSDFRVTLYPFRCRLTGGTMTPNEHNEIRWIEPWRMPELDWAAADIPVVSEYLAMVAAENLSA